MTTWPLALLGIMVAVCLVGCASDPSNAANIAGPEQLTGEIPETTPIATESLSAPVVQTSLPPTSTPTLRPVNTPVPATGLLRLVDFLDDPLGYCVDVAGFGANLRLDAPLQAHTCKPGSDDQLFSRLNGGGMRLTQHDRCLTVIQAVDGSEVMVSPCDAGGSWQRIRLKDDGRIRLAADDGSALCLGVAGGSGEPAGGRNHLRRDLTLQDCDGAKISLIQWELVMQ